jgi:endonuclease-3 related protein
MSCVTGAWRAQRRMFATNMKPTAVRDVYDRLLISHGPQRWWPAETPFEVMIGAILTQNTAWSNVERAIERLRGRCALDAEALLALPENELADAIRPAGYFNVKARRLRAFCVAFDAAGGFESWSALSTPELRKVLLVINGVGPETADDILLYAFERPVFVVDAYTRRIFERLGLLAGGETYETVRAAFEQALGPDTELFNHYHALIVQHGKDICRARHPACADCCLRERCPAAA